MHCYDDAISFGFDKRSRRRTCYWPPQPAKEVKGCGKGVKITWKITSDLITSETMATTCYKEQ